MSRDPLLYLEDIVEASERVAGYLEGVQYDSFMTDPMRVDAVVRNLGEPCEVREYAENALVGPSSWHRFVRAAKAAENESLHRWIAVNQGTIETQFARRALTPPGRLICRSPAQRSIRSPVRSSPHPRRYALKNRERLNRLLMLLQLHVNGDDDV